MTSRLQVRAEIDEGVAAMYLQGRIDIDSSPRVRDELLGVLRR
jgi:hypothetical protein